jgi:hypothetical protein
LLSRIRLRNLTVGTNERALSETGRAEDITPQACEMHTLGFICGEDKPILQGPSRQTIYSTLNPAFDGDNAPGTVVNRDVHIQ